MTVEKVNETFFIDEKLFKLHKPRNTQNNHVYFRSKEEILDDRFICKTFKFPQECQYICWIV